jgi:radical SAM superfamily enzyme YgiQ (UPF0313 family)
VAAIDFLLVHVSSEQQNNRVFTMAMGLLPLADMLNQRGIQCQIIHTEVEKRLDQTFDLSAFVKKHNIKYVGFSLHWHFQLFYTLEEIRKIKESSPNTIVMLGGYTAGYFSRDILGNFPHVDFVIRGDAEIPLATLMGVLVEDNKKHRLNTVPNLSWKNGEEIIENELSYVATSDDLNRQNHGNAPLVAHHKKYYLYCGGAFHYNIGRGCPVNCSFCGGSRLSQVILNQRKGVIYKAIDEIIEDLKSFRGHGLDHWYTCFDPFPMKDSFYIELFEAISKNNLDLRLTFESWAIPSRRFIDSFAQTFVPDTSFIVISPESGSEKVRKKNKGYFYTNNDLLDILRYLSQLRVNVVLYFTAGLPGETPIDFAQTLDMVNFLRLHFPQYLINVMPIALEPASPWSLDSKDYGITVNKRGFFDFYNASRHEGALGYETPYFSEADIKTATTILKMEAICSQVESKMLTYIRSHFGEHLGEEPFKWANVMAQCEGCLHFYGCHMSASGP